MRRNEEEKLFLMNCNCLRNVKECSVSLYSLGYTIHNLSISSVSMMITSHTLNLFYEKTQLTYEDSITTLKKIKLISVFYEKTQFLILNGIHIINRLTNSNKTC